MMLDNEPGLDAAAVLRARRRRLMGPGYELFYEEPVHLVRGEGVWLYDAEGNRYLDAYNNVASVGHCHPHVVAALTRQASTLNTHTRYLHATVLDYAEKLLGTMPASLGHLLMTCTGSESNDLAMRIAMHHTGGTGVIVTRLAYHGNTIAVSEISPSTSPDVPMGLHHRTVIAPDTYRCPDLSFAFAADMQAVLDDMHRHGIRPAAFLFDTGFSSDGIFFPEPATVRDAVELVRAAGALVIADEVQAGFGRTGEMWGFGRLGLEPDMVTMGKPMGDGHPVAGVAVRPELLHTFGPQTHYFNTFGGNPVSAAVALAVLEVIESEKLADNAATVGRRMNDGLTSLAGKHDIIGDVRGAGLYIGVELVRDRGTRAPASAETPRVVNGLRRHRVLISSCGPHGNVLKIRPPLPFAPEHAELFLATLDQVLAEI